MCGKPLPVDPFVVVVVVVFFFSFKAVQCTLQGGRYHLSTSFRRSSEILFAVKLRRNKSYNAEN